MIAVLQEVCRFDVIGVPGPQGSKRHVGRGVMIESSRKVKPWREAVVWAAREVVEKRMQSAAVRLVVYGHVLLPVPIDGPLVLSMVFTLPKPASAPKRRRTWPDKKPDLSKLARSTEDALVDAGLIRDDARIVEYERLAKVFPGEDPAALDVPGVRIVVYKAVGMGDPVGA